MNTYQLFFYDKIRKESRLLTENEDIDYDFFAWDFYAAEEYIFFETMKCTIPVGAYSYYAYIIPKEGYKVDWESRQIINVNTENNNTLVKNTDLVFWSNGEMNFQYQQEILSFIGAAYDEMSDTIVYSSSDRYNRTNMENIQLIGKYQNKFLCTEENTVYLVNEKGQVEQKKSVDSAERFIFGFIKGDSIYLIGQTKKGKEIICQLELGSLEQGIHYKLDKGEKAVAMMEKNMVCVTNKEIRLRDMENGEIMDTMKWDQKIDLRKDTIEMAADYILVYDYSKGITIKNKQEIEWQKFDEGN